VSPLAHPDWAAPLLAAWAVLALLAGSALWRARRRLAQLGSHALRAGGVRDLALCAALLAVLVALLGPQLGTRSVAVPADGIDLVVLVDLSRSMDATDAAPSRLARARQAARGVLLGLAPGDRAALAVFAGRGALLTPLTYDAGALVEMLPSLDSEWMSDRGSRFWAGVEAAMGAFEPGSLRPRIVLAFGDGERAQLAPAALLEALPREQVRVVAAAIGSEAGTVLMGPAGPARDWNGESVVTRRDTRGFERFAEVSGGSVLVADEWGALDANALLAAVRHGLRPGPGGTLLRELPAVQTTAPAALAFLLLLAELLLGDRGGLGASLRVRFGRLRRFALAASALLALGAGTPDLEALESLVKFAPEDARALVALGVARAEAGEPEEAARALAAAVVRARGPEQIALASYDLGVALLELRDFAGARDAFFDALAYDPGDRQAKFNLEWSLRALASETPPVPPEATRPPDEPPAEPEASAESEQAKEPQQQPAPAPESEPDAAAQREAEAEAETEKPPPADVAPLTPEEVARWLESVRDVPPPALRRAHEADSAPRSGPQW
jgi:Ca-activated chloride channel family protein